jgi:CRISPR system Cascade subunit CasC
MFIQIHTLTGYTGVLLNRDDSGMSKRLRYGESTRTRTSSQFTKRKIRKANGDFAISSLGSISVRSRETFKREIAIPLIDGGLNEDTVIDATVCIMDLVFPLSVSAQKTRNALMAKIETGKIKKISRIDGKIESIPLLERDELNILSPSEIKYIKNLVKDITGSENIQKSLKDLLANDMKKNLKLVGENMSLDVAMFGRMTTGDMLSTVDAAIYVAHAFSTHAQNVELDFFTAVDDLLPKESAHLGETEITSPLLYGYYVVDWAQLMHNLQAVKNKEEVGVKLVENLIHLVSESVVGAKKGSTAPYSSSDFVMVEIGKKMPRTLAEAFRHKVDSTLEAGIKALKDYVKKKDLMYGKDNLRIVACVEDVKDTKEIKDTKEVKEIEETFGQQMPLNDLISCVAAEIIKGE